jgi:hypothetical protein
VATGTDTTVTTGATVAATATGPAATTETIGGAPASLVDARTRREAYPQKRTPGLWFARDGAPMQLHNQLAPTESCTR